MTTLAAAMNPDVKKRTLKYLWYVVMILATVVTLFPIYWSVVTSLKKASEIVQMPATYFPSVVTWTHFATAWNTLGFMTFFKNSFYVSLVSMIFTVIFATMAGFALARYQFKFKKSFLLMILCTQFFPGAMLIIPLFMIYNTMGLINSHLSLILTYTTFHIPFNAILMSGFIANIPVELEEAAMVDGCTRFGAITKIVLPVLVPGLVATSAFAFISSWNDFLYALMFLSKNTKFTIPVGLHFMIGEYSIDYGAMAAGSVISMVPLLLLFAYVQKFLVSGLSSGAVKG